MKIFRGIKTAAVMILAVFILMTGCMNKQKQPVQESKNIGYYEDQNRNNRINISTVPGGEQDYAKWGKLALQETENKYPNSKVKDYQYDTRRVSPDGTITDYFDFTLYQGSTKRLVKAAVTHSGDKLVDIKFDEIG